MIDDEELLGQTIELGLEGLAVVSRETSGKRGLARLLSGNHFVLILCDLNLPDLSGVEIYSRAVDEQPVLAERFVIMTGGAISTRSQDFLDTYKGHLLCKPFTLTQLESLVKTLLAF